MRAWGPEFVDITWYDFPSSFPWTVVLIGVGLGMLVAERQI